MKIKTLEDVTTKEIVDVFNHSFSDYFIPFKLTEAQLEQKMLADKTDLSLSVGAFENEKPIAFILHGFDTIDNQNVVYNGGTGVIPEKRGSGLTKQMYHFIIPLLIEKQIDRLLLEVITENIQAIKSYQSAGYKTKRELVCYKGDVKLSHTHKTIAIKSLHHYNWNLMTSFWDIAPTWQNSNAALDELKHNNISLGAFTGDQLIGYIIFNPSSKRIQQIAVDKGFRRKGIASALILELVETYGKTLSIINVDKTSIGANHFFSKIGLENNINQFEMELELNKNQ